MWCLLSGKQAKRALLLVDHPQHNDVNAFLLLCTCLIECKLRIKTSSVRVAGEDAEVHGKRTGLDVMKARNPGLDWCLDKMSFLKIILRLYFILQLNGN